MEFKDKRGGEAFSSSSFSAAHGRRKFSRVRIDSNVAFKVVGKERTGTNYLHTLLAKNLMVKFLTHAAGGKHSLPMQHKRVLLKKKELIGDTPLLAVVVIKNPYTWFDSISSWVLRQNSPWLPGPQATEHYNNFYRTYMELMENGIQGYAFNDAMIVRYEDALEDEDRELKRVADRLGGVEVKPYMRKPKQVEFSSGFSEERREYYIAQRPKYGRRLIKIVNERIDWEVMDYYGYKRIEI